ncbi:AraC family transcriptional regulator [Cohnella phaseoli]|uniref:ABC-type Fe3+-hydroxamate transport system substrate-binding protein n=1 Tax=Cohnella phaseoli TaxID=456490 RepID=A0A3D9JMP5_9BACL|nr:helix-turn-helix domain-containing protein [Cohnella phaseoli]RED75265.1 ABC-type Fe3+-hydroxamate transport system substrate-binding protein [Cohnella phaseoli]
MEHDSGREAGAPIGGGLGNVWFQLKESIRERENKTCRIVYTSAPTFMLFVPGQSYGKIVIDGLLYPLQANSAYFVAAGQRVETHYERKGDYPQYRFLFDLVGPEEEIQRTTSWLTERGRFSTAADSRLLLLCNKTAEGWSIADPIARLAGQAGFLELLYLLFRRQDEHGEALERVRAYLESAYRETVTVEDLADKAGMSRYYFMRSFKERFGQSVMEYMTELRTNEAKRLMEAGESLRKVSETVGYKDPLYFSSQFKKHVGISPSSYIASRKCRTAAYSWPNVGQLLTLGIIPYAAPIDQSWSDDYRRKYRFDVKVPLSHDYSFNRQALTRACPDRIVALDEMIIEEEKIRLRQIAPTLFLRWHKESWKEHLIQVARFIEREKEGEQWLDRYEGQAEELRSIVPSAFRSGRLLILNICARGMQIWGKRAGSVLYNDLRIPCAAGVEQIPFTEFATVERLSELDADTLLVTVVKDRESQAEWERLQLTEAWKGLRAVRNRNVYRGSDRNWLQEPILEYTANRQELLLQDLKQLFRAL